MSKIQTLRAFVNQRLSAAAEEIFELYEGTIAEYEEELCRQRELLDAVLRPDGRSHRADNQLMLASTEEDPPEQQEWSPGLDQEDPPELPQIKEEQEELWSSQEGEQLQGLEEADITKFTFSPVPVKSEEDEENPQSSQLHQRQTEQNRGAEHLKTEADGEDCGGSEPAGNFKPASHLQPASQDNMSLSSEPDLDDSYEWEETREPQSSLNLQHNNELPISDMECNTGKMSISSSECATSFGNHSAEKPFSCSVCGKKYQWKKTLATHMRSHSEGQSYSCPICHKTFQQRGNVVTHMRSHTGEKPFSCSVCTKEFSQKETLRQHMRIHTGEKPFSCSVCGKGFTQSSNLTSHFRIHTGEKPFTCTVCNARFSLRKNLSLHMRVHTGEKPFSCSFCGKGFVDQGNLGRHLTVHTGEKPFSCNICDKRFTRLAHLKKHKCVGESSGSQLSYGDACGANFFQQD